MSKSTLSIVAAIAVMALGSLPLLGLLGASGEESDPAPSVTAVPVVATTSLLAAEPEVVTISESTPDIGELSPAIATLLQARGFAENAPAADLERELPPSVVRLLIERDVVLTVASDGASTGEAAP